MSENLNVTDATQKSPPRYEVWSTHIGVPMESQQKKGVWCKWDDIAPLIQRIAELEAWLDKPDKPGWWITRHDNSLIGYRTARVASGDLELNCLMFDSIFGRVAGWRFIAE